MTELLASLGRTSLASFERLGRGSLFFCAVVARLGTLLSRLDLVLAQLWAIGVRSLVIIVVSGAFVGMVLALQGYNTLVTFGAAESLGVVVAKSLTRELGPVLAALLFAGRAGSALTAEIGLMRATEQLSALEMMAIDPLSRVIAPRFVAGFCALPLLAAIFTAVGIIGGYLCGVGLLGVDDGAFWSQMQSHVALGADIGNGVVVKSTIFGLVVTWIALFEGYDAVPTSEGVAAATTRTVVNSSLAVLGLDFVLTGLMFN